QGVLLDKSRREFVYQAGGKLVMEYISNWLQGPGRWDTTARVVSTYNQVNSLLSEEVQLYNRISGTWLINERRRYEYDNLHRLVYEYEDARSGSWSNPSMDTFVRFAYTYNSQGLVDTLQYENYYNSTWWANFREVYTYTPLQQEDSTTN